MGRSGVRESGQWRSLVLLLASLAPCVLCKPLASMEIMKLDNIDPEAVCNDGSPGAYYFHKASDPAQANVWLVYLEGGDWCYSAQSCAVRFNVGPQFMTTDKWPGVISLGGIFDENPTKSPWAGANKVYVGYCSSDAWVGDVPASEATSGLAFRGQRIISATLGSLVLNHQLGATSGQRLLFSGCSAGGRGAMFTIDYVPAILHDLGVQDGYVQLQGLFDSPMWVDIEPITGANGPIVPLQEQAAAVLTLVNATGRLGDACAASFPPADWWKCLFGQYRLPFVTTPFVLNAAQFDKFALPYNEGGNPPYGAAGLQYADAFQSAIRSALAPLPTLQQNGSAVFSAACFHHCVTQEPSFWAIKVYNVSFRMLAAAWFFHDQAPLRYVESCTGFKCGTCRSHRKHPGAPPDPRAKPPRAPQPPDPFAVWSPPPPPAVLPKGRGAMALRVGAHGWQRAAAAAAAAAALFCAACALLARRGRRLRIQSGERALELEGESLLGGAGGEGGSPRYGTVKPVAPRAPAGRAGGVGAAVSPAAGAPRRGIGGAPRAGPRPAAPPRPSGV